MALSGILLIIFGFALVIALIIAIFYYFNGKRKARIEEPKYDMLKDDDDKLP